MRCLTLSFDNGPNREVTPQVLDVLKRRGVKATFFVVGQRLADPEAYRLSERACAEGHWIGNHTWTHSVPLGLRPELDVADKEIGRTQALIGKLAHPDRLFRPFGRGGALGAHLLSGRSVDYLKAGGFSCVLWNAVPRDWEIPDGWVEPALQQCEDEVWSLMVLHDIATGAMEHLDRFLGLVADRDVHVRQDFPPRCVPIVRGEVVGALDEYVTRQAA